MKAIDLFAGAGGFSFSAHNVGSIEVVAAIEFDKAAAQTYKKNLIENCKHLTEFLEDDILIVSPKKLREKLKLKKKELGLILGGPPCQGFQVIESMTLVLMIREINYFSDILTSYASSNLKHF